MLTNTHWAHAIHHILSSAIAAVKRSSPQLDTVRLLRSTVILTGVFYNMGVTSTLVAIAMPPVMITLAFSGIVIQKLKPGLLSKMLGVSALKRWGHYLWALPRPFSRNSESHESQSRSLYALVVQLGAAAYTQIKQGLNNIINTVQAFLMRQAYQYIIRPNIGAWLKGAAVNLAHSLHHAVRNKDRQQQDKLQWLQEKFWAGRWGLYQLNQPMQKLAGLTCLVCALSTVPYFSVFVGKPNFLILFANLAFAYILCNVSVNVNWGRPINLPPVKRAMEFEDPAEAEKSISEKEAGSDLMTFLAEALKVYAMNPSLEAELSSYQKYMSA